MGTIEIGTYAMPDKTGWRGWYGSRTWIAFVRDGQTIIYQRDSETGAVIGDPLVC